MGVESFNPTGCHAFGRLARASWMLTRAVAHVGRLARTATGRNPWTNVYGTSRSLLALATAGTLAFNQIDVLFTPAAGVSQAPMCDGTYLRCSLFCLFSYSRLGTVRWLCVAALGIIATGWRPRITALPHAWLCYSAFWSSTLRDGGDQIALALSVLILPVALLDSRRWHWQSPDQAANSTILRLIAWSSLGAARLQVAIVYAVAAISKLGQSEWANGTALYYWLLYFGAPHWFMGIVTRPVVLVAMTWGAIAIELSLAIGLLLPATPRRVLLRVAIGFHFMIAVVFGLWSFSLTMTAALIVYLRPADRPYALPFLITHHKEISAISAPSVM